MSVSVIEKEKELLAPLLFAAVFFAGVFFPLLEDLAVLAMILLLLLFSDMKALVLLFVFAAREDWYECPENWVSTQKGGKTEEE